MKLSNFASLDPKHIDRGIKGLSNTSRADVDAWHEFTGDWNKTVWDSEILMARLKRHSDEEAVQTAEINTGIDELADWETSDTVETQTERITKIRIGQQFFRKTVLANYRSECCICGMPIPRLLVASHIVPWKDREDLRLNPHNGLCMCALHDKAFDGGLLTIDEQYRVVVSKKVSNYLPNTSIETMIIHHHGSEILLPDKFMPEQAFLNYHFTTYFMAD